jgi:hypothetical protein
MLDCSSKPKFPIGPPRGHEKRGARQDTRIVGVVAGGPQALSAYEPARVQINVFASGRVGWGVLFTPS